MFKDHFSKTIKFWCLVGIIIVAIAIALIIMLKYSLEGETKMPYKLSKITIISTAKGIENVQDEVSANAWSLDVVQLNDIYISIDKTEFAKEDQFISSVRIENFKITKSPNHGRIKIYMPNSLDGELYNYTDDFLVQNSLQYNGASKSNSQTLEVGSQGGLVLISFLNTELGKFISSNISDEIMQNGTLITKINEAYNTTSSTEETQNTINESSLENNTTNTNSNITSSENTTDASSEISNKEFTPITEEDLKFSVSFDLIIKVNKTEYKGTVNLDLPVGEILENGAASLEITDFSNVIFKR